MFSCYDWNSAWQDAQAASTFTHNDEEFWNKRAASFAAYSEHKSDYPQQFLNIVNPKPDWRVLDVGCGPGTVAIPMARLVAKITALDFSQEMLAILKRHCKEMALTKITPVKAAWADDWQALGITAHDLVIASRSLVAQDLKGAIEKLNRFAARKVCITAPVGSGPFDPRIIRAAGRPFHSGPDYIYILNQLHQMGVYARLDFTIHPVNRTYANHDDAVDECHWMLPKMTDEEKNRLDRFFKEKLIYKEDRWFLPDTPPVRWAVISWDIG